MFRNVSGRYSGQQDESFFGFHADAGDRRVGSRIFPCVEPVHPRAKVGDTCQRLALSPFHAGNVRLFRQISKWVGFVVGDSFKTVFTPMACHHADVAAACDGNTDLRSVAIEDHIVADRFAEASFAFECRRNTLVRIGQGHVVRGVHEYQPAGGRDLDRCAAAVSSRTCQNPVHDKWKTPRRTFARRGRRPMVSEHFGHFTLRQRFQRSVSLYADFPKQAGCRSIM